MYKIAIPSYSRSDIIKNKTLNTLERFNVSISLIYIFVVQEEYDLYNSLDYNIIVGNKGLINQRKFIENYFHENELIICIDDDITDFDFKEKTFDEFANEAFHTCLNNGAFIWSVYPVWNSFYRQKQKYMTTDLRFIHGGFYGFINRKSIDYNLRPLVSVAERLPNDMKEDVERTLLYFIRDGIVIRFNQYGFNSKMYSKGGCGLFKDRLKLNEESTDYLVEKYSDYGKRKIRKNGCHEFNLTRKSSVLKSSIASGDLIINKAILSPYLLFMDIIQWKINPSVVSTVEDMLKNINLPIKAEFKVDSKGYTNNNRKGFPRFRGGVLGLCKQKIGRKICLSQLSKKKPKLYEELLLLGKKICPFEFTSIQINNNLVCPKHIDSNNVGKSLLLSFGDYEGCNIIINDTEYNAKYNPIIFDGSKLEHSNTELISGNKYSLIFFNIKNN